MRQTQDYIYEAVQRVCDIKTPERFCEMNSTLFNVARAAVEAVLEDAKTEIGKSPLPSNLEGAAFDYENNLWEAGFKNSGYTSQEVYDAFKAGAEWREAQNQKFSDGLEESVKQIVNNTCKDLPNGESKDTIRYYAILAAISSAKWMETNGVTYEGRAIRRTDPLGSYSYIVGGEADAVRKLIGPNEEADVIVQIRKK